MTSSSAQYLIQFNRFSFDLHTKAPSTTGQNPFHIQKGSTLQAWHAKRPMPPYMHVQTQSLSLAMPCLYCPHYKQLQAGCNAGLTDVVPMAGHPAKVMQGAIYRQDALQETWLETLGSGISSSSSSTLMSA